MNLLYKLMIKRGGAVAPTTINIASATVVNAMYGLKDTARNGARVYNRTGLSTFAFNITGTEAKFTATSDAGDLGGGNPLLSASIDGGAFTAITPVGQVYTLFTGLPQATRRVVIKWGAAYGDGPYVASSGNILDITGAPPSLSAPANKINDLGTSNVIYATPIGSTFGAFVPAPTGKAGLFTHSARFIANATYLDLVSNNRYVFVSTNDGAPVMHDLGSVSDQAAGYKRVTVSGNNTYTVWARGNDYSASGAGIFSIGLDAAPTAVSAKRLVQFGDSITVGDSATDAGFVDTMITATNLGMVGTNFGISGYVASQLNTQLDTWLPLITTDITKDVAVLAIGRNDFADTGAAFQTAYNSCIDKLLTKFKKVICRGLINQGTNTFSWPSQNAVISGLVTARGNAFVTFVDPGAWSGVTYADGVHPTDAGYVTLAAYCTAAYPALI